MALPKLLKKDATSDNHKNSTKIDANNTKTKSTTTKHRKIVSLLSLPKHLRRIILYHEFRAYIPLEVTYRLRGKAPSYIDQLAGIYKRAVPECAEDVEIVAQKAKDSVETLCRDPVYYC